MDKRQIAFGTLLVTGASTLVLLTGCGPLAPKSHSNQPGVQYPSDAHLACASDHPPIQLTSDDFELHSLNDLPPGTLRYEMSQFYVEQRSGSALSQMHVIHADPRNKAAVACVTQRADSPVVHWSAGIPASVSKAEGKAPEIRWWKVSAEINTAEHAWDYSSAADGAESAPHPRTEDGTARWYRVSESEYHLRARIDTGAIGTIQVVYRFTPAPRSIR